MAKHRFVIDGTIETHAGASSRLARNEARTSASELLWAIEVTPTSREAGVDQQTPPLDDTDLVEIALDGGGHLWMSVAELRASDLVDDTPTRSRGPQRVHRSLPASLRTRGLGDWAIRAMRFFRIDPAAELANATERRMVDYIEGLLAIEPGLYRLDDDAAVPIFVALGARPRFDDQPYLLFLHGTNSSTQGSFGDLWTHDGGSAIRALRERYGEGHLLALQHRTLSESPVANALMVARAIPDNARIDIVSHSRGGLIGELLARASVAADQAPFTTNEIAQYRSASSAQDARDLEALGTLLAKRRYTIARFVRVACPARGTTLASDKISRYCNILLNLIDARLLAAVDGMAATLFALLKATIKDLVDFSDLPGLAAMHPASPLVKLLNGEARIVSADLTIIAGDTEGGSWVGRLGMLLVDAFFDRDNDLVVDTTSMHGGSLRAAPAHQYLQRAADINHLCYFRHAVTLERIVRALCEADPLRRRAGFSQVDIAQDALSREPVALKPVTRSTRALPPIVFVVPGIMGTHLKVKDDRVWLSYPRLVFGGFGKLRVSAREVVPDGLDGDTYADLVDFLARSHEVIPFGYDWRLPVEAAAIRLNEALHAVLARIDSRHQPIRIVAHSMGGLVARAMMLLDDSAWPLVCRHADARLLMLGTPNAGSHSITQLLFGEEKLVRMLATFDLRNRLDTIVGQIAEFPGALDMLPESDERAYFDAATWSELAKEAKPADWPTPTAAALARARRWRDRLAQQVLDPARVFYVAGQADETPSEIDIETVGSRKRIRFRSTAAGDGRVPWQGGIPPALRAWYTNARHGDLAAHAPAHTGYLDILERGQTAEPALREERPAVRAALRTIDGAIDVPAAWLARPTEVASLPTIDEIAREASGRTVAVRGTKHREAPLPIRVAWGDLRQARHAVMVGHYVGDSLISAEAAIDRALGGRLGESHRLGIYPGEAGTSLAITDNTARPPGVVVIGLGDIGKLSPGALGDAVARGVVAWIGSREDQRRRSGEIVSAGGLSLLLIGAGEGGVDADTAVFSILRGVREGIDRGRRAGIAASLAEIEFIELYRDRAHRLWHALDRLLAEGELQGRYVLSGPIVASGDGKIRLWEAAPSGWWRRLQISVPENYDTAKRADTLLFTSLTDSARSEAYRLPFQADVVDTLIAQSITSTERDEAREKTLFELMLPIELKERAPQRESLVLLLDRTSANLPWELLTDPLERIGGDAEDHQPLAIRAGLVRQFSTSRFRQRPSVVADNTALVIGDPKASANYPELPGAQREAHVVAGLLETNARFRVEHLHRPGAEQVVQSLLPKRFRILHIAGHGTLGDGSSDADSGIVLDAFKLTWRSLDQMRAIPELVFINCCHLGRVGAGSRDDSLSQRNAFAAGVGEVFIRNGARAVIAAGWAVEDHGAEIFARTFYARMLAGDRFGNAVRHAREATYDAERRSNTWGAYQCYGDPDYRLVTSAASAVTPWPEPRYASTEEMITDAIDTIAGGDLDVASRERMRQQIGAFATAAQNLEPLQRARVQLALARASARSRLHGEAIAHYQDALDADGDALSLADLAVQAEQYVAVAMERTDGVADAKAVEKSLDIAIERFERLLAIRPHDGRRLLLARTWLHLAAVRAGDAQSAALDEALQHLEALESESSQALLLRSVIAWRTATPPLRSRKRLRERLGLLPAYDDDDPRAVHARFEASVIDVLLAGKVTPARRTELLAIARRARASGTPLSTAMIDPLSFTIAMLVQVGSTAGVRMRSALQGIDAAPRRGD